MKNMKNLKYIVSAFVLAIGLSSCVGDLNVDPIDPNIMTSGEAMSSADAYQSTLAQLYVGFATSGYYGPDGGPSISGLDGGMSQYMRGLYHLNGLTTDEAVCGWNDQTIQDLHGMAWTTTDVFITAFFARVFYQIALCNEYLRQAAAVTFDVPNLDVYCAEARTLRALCWYHAIDNFGNVPFADETSVVGLAAPERKTRAEMFTWLEAELKDIIENSAIMPARKNVYGRVDVVTAQMILAKLYLNAEVYTGEAKYQECMDVCQQIAASGYGLHTTVHGTGDNAYQELFLADNHRCSDEIIFAIQQDGNDIQSYGVTNYLIFASTGGGMDAASVGISSGWGGIRTTPEHYSKFLNGDKRNLFFTDGQELEIKNVGNFKHGYAFMKFKNINSDGTNGKQKGFVDTDWPVFRYADALLMIAECAARGASEGAMTGLEAYNKVHARAGLGEVSAYTLDSILNERACELYQEGWRRSDLIRFNKFTTDSYIWAWKGGVKDGRSVSSHMNLFPIPEADIIANPNLVQNPGY